MSRSEAIERAKQHLETDAEPLDARFFDRPDGRRYWSVVFAMETLMTVEKGATVDGPYVLHVDADSGEISVLG